MQGSAADLAKQAMVDIDRAFGEMPAVEGRRPRMLVNIHDELLFEVLSRVRCPAVSVGCATDEAACLQGLCVLTSIFLVGDQPWSC